MSQPPRVAAQSRVTPPRQVFRPLSPGSRGPAPVAARGNLKGAPKPGYLQSKFNGAAPGGSARRLTPIFNPAANPPSTPPKQPPEKPPGNPLQPKGPTFRP